MNLRNGKQVAACTKDRRYRVSPIQQFASINLAKKANGLNAGTCKHFPPEGHPIESPREDSE